jgi:multicomponent Na+:H+ antiporter subunit G
MIYPGWLLISVGLFVIISGIIALFRFPDFYTKLHGASVIESCGIPFCLIGLSLMQDSYINSFKLVIITLLVFILNPVGTHALGRASLIYKIDRDGRIK